MLLVWTSGEDCTSWSLMWHFFQIERYMWNGTQVIKQGVWTWGT